MLKRAKADMASVLASAAIYCQEVTNDTSQACELHQRVLQLRISIKKK